MKKKYDFSKAEQGKFYRPIEELEIPIYLDKDDLPEIRGRNPYSPPESHLEKVVPDEWREVEGRRESRTMGMRSKDKDKT